MTHAYNTLHVSQAWVLLFAQKFFFLDFFVIEQQIEGKAC